MDKFESLYEKELSREYIYKGKVFDIVRCHAELSDKTPVKREIMVHCGGVGVLPVDNNGNIYLVRQYRYGAGDLTLEIPAGRREEGEDTLECAKRELREETGFTSSNIVSMGYLLTSPAILSEKIFIYLARDLVNGMQDLDFDERLSVVKVHIDDAINMIMNGEILDSKTQIAIFKAKNIIG